MSKEKKFKITTDQLMQLENEFTLPKLQKWFPEIFVKKLKVGKWYRNQDEGYEESIACVTEINSENNSEFAGYGFDSLGNWVSYKCVEAFGSSNWVEVTEQEVFEALKNEAIKRGFVEGVYCKHEKPTMDQKEEIKGFTYAERCNSLYGDSEGFGGARIFKDGIWATIIQTKTRSQAERELNCKIID